MICTVKNISWTKKDQEREAILKTIPAGMVRIDARDLDTILWHNGIFLDMIGYTQVQLEEELHFRCSNMSIWMIFPVFHWYAQV